MRGKLNSAVTKVTISVIMLALIAGMIGCGDYTPPQEGEIRDWYDLDDIRNNLGGSYVLMNDLNSTTSGYEQLAGPTANEGKGWQPIGGWDALFSGRFDGQGYEIHDLLINRPEEFTAGLFGTVYEDAVIKNVGLVNADVTGYDVVGGLVGFNWGNMSYCYSTGSVTGTGSAHDVMGVGGLVAVNAGNISYCHSTGIVTGVSPVGGLVGVNGYFAPATVSNSYSTGDVTGESGVGGLVGMNGLLGPGGGVNGTVSDSYSTGSVAGEDLVGGLVGFHYYGTVSNSYYDCDTVLINGESVITIGALLNGDFDRWLANDKFLDINERLSEEDGYYVVNNVADFKQLLAFGQDVALKFRLTDDLDLAAEPDFYIPYLGGQFDGDGHRISNLNLNLDFVCNVGLFGYLAPGGNVIGLAAEDVSITGEMSVGGLVGRSGGAVADSSSTGSVVGLCCVGGLVASNYGTVGNSSFTGTATGGSSVGGLAGENGGTVNNSHSNGSVAGEDYVGGLVGQSSGTVSSSYSNGNVNGDYSVGGLVGANDRGTVNNSYSSSNVTGNTYVGGLLGSNTGTVTSSYFAGSISGITQVGGVVGQNYHRCTVSNSYYDYDEVLINGEKLVTRGALFHQDFEQWLADDKFLDVNERLSQEDGYYLINDVNDFKQLLAFGEDAALKFRLTNDLDLATEPNFYIPYLAGEFDGNGHKISNFSFNFTFVWTIGLFGDLGPGGNLIDLAAENVNIAGHAYVGGLVGYSRGTVSGSCSTGSITGGYTIGGLVGYVDEGSVSDSYSTSSVTGSSIYVGGLVGRIWVGTVSDSYSTGTVTGVDEVGGLVGYNAHGTVNNCHSGSNVTGEDVIGGLVAENGGTVSDSYSSSNVTGEDVIGGLVAVNGGIVSNSYSSGSVTGYEYVGGLVGRNLDTVSNSFWDTQTSGQSTSDGGTGKTTAEMQDIVTFSGAGWDIVLIGDYADETWYIDDGNDYPRLGWQHP